MGLVGGADATAGLDAPAGPRLRRPSTRQHAPMRRRWGEIRWRSSQKSAPASSAIRHNLDQSLLAAGANQRGRLDDHLQDDVVRYRVEDRRDVGPHGVEGRLSRADPMSITMSILVGAGPATAKPGLLGLDRRKDVCLKGIPRPIAMS